MDVHFKNLDPKIADTCQDQAAALAFKSGYGEVTLSFEKTMTKTGAFKPSKANRAVSINTDLDGPNVEQHVAFGLALAHENKASLHISHKDVTITVSKNQVPKVAADDESKANIVKTVTAMTAKRNSLDLGSYTKIKDHVKCDTPNKPQYEIYRV